MEKALTPSPFSVELIAPCGINCGICRAFLRPKNKCAGCRQIVDVSQKARFNCVIRNCAQRAGPFCDSCPVFPCERIKHLDKRYQLRYAMSEIANLTLIHEQGINSFIDSETEKWIEDGCVRCVHDKKLYPLAKE